MSGPIKLPGTGVHEETDKGPDWPFLQETDPSQRPTALQVKGRGPQEVTCCRCKLDNPVSRVHTSLCVLNLFELRVRRCDDSASTRNLLVATGTALAGAHWWRGDLVT